MQFALTNAELSPWVYIHYPLCQHHCSYCDFNVVSVARAPKNFEEQWLNTLRLQITALHGRPKIPLKGLYFGGGTSSLISLKTLAELKKELLSIYDWELDTEVTLECNPENLTEEYVLGLSELGITRPSLGVQTTKPDQLRRLERLSTANNIFRSVEMLAKKFTNYSLDLMIGIPAQTLETLNEDLDFILKIQPPHISVYLLTLDATHKMKTSPAIRGALAGPDLASKMYERVCEFLGALGYNHYEVSNFSRPGFESQHNSNYWNSESDYLGFGPGAHGYLKISDGRRLRYETEKDLMRWVNDQNGVASFEILTAEQRDLERVYLSLRSKTPIAVSQFSDAKVNALVEHGFLHIDAGQLTPTERGWLVIESLAAELLF